MFSKLLLASVASIGLLLAGPPKANAQVIYACVSSIGNIAIVAANASCPPNVGGTTWTKVTLSQTPGAITASLFSCIAGSVLTNGGPLAGSAGRFGTGLQFGSGVSYANGTTFVLQPGIYQV